MSNSAHRRRAAFAFVQRGEFVDFVGGADRLADLEFGEFADDEVAHPEAQEKRRQTRAACSGGDVFEDVKRAEIVA